MASFVGIQCFVVVLFASANAKGNNSDDEDSTAKLAVIVMNTNLY